MKMIGNNVLIVETEKEATSSGGIILTESIDKGSKPGLVLAVGGGALGTVMSGNRVFLDWSKSLPVNVEGKAAVIIDVEHIKAIINED
jgi:co-chaperonin GroES (HSP10)